MVSWITVEDLAEYGSVLNLMEDKVTEVINGANDTIYFVEHRPVYTAGTSAVDSSELLVTNTHINIPVFYTGRGGKFTYHGPGQRVIYPIINLATPFFNKDLKSYIKFLQLWVINSLQRIGVKAYASDKNIGVWTEYQNYHLKIAALGIRVKKWVAYHGIAVNISTDLSYFQGISPCGLESNSVTSLKAMRINISMKEFDNILKEEFKKLLVNSLKDQVKT